MEMKGKDHTLRELVVCAAANDYEDFETVVYTLTRWAAEQGTATNRQTIYATLCEVINDGYVRAYVYAEESARFKTVDCSLENLDELWFYVTDKGKKLVAELDGIDGK
jgi:hypothetical protein